MTLLKPAIICTLIGVRRKVEAFVAERVSELYKLSKDKHKDKAHYAINNNNESDWYHQNDKCLTIKSNTDYAYVIIKVTIMVLTLYKLDASPPVRSVLMVIEAAKIPDVNYIDVNLLEGDQFKEEYQKLNPQHTVPLLTDDNFVIWDSHAIAIYLVTKYSNNGTLYPTDPKKRAIVDQRLHYDSGILFPTVRGALEPVIFKGEKSFYPQDLEKIKKAYEFSERFLTGPWMAGDEFTLADICCVTSISSMNEILPIDEKLYPNITAWLKRCGDFDFYKTKNEPGLLLLRQLLRSKLE